MTTAATPAPDTKLLMQLHSGLNVLMDRTKDLPQMRDTVARTDERVETLQAAFEKHCEATDAEFRRIRTASIATRERVADTREQVAEQKGFDRGRWKGIALACGAISGFLAGAVEVARAFLPHKP